MQKKIKRRALAVCLSSVLVLLTMGIVNTAMSATCDTVKVVCTTSLVNPVQPALAGCTWVSSNTIWCTRSDCDNDNYPNEACPNFPAGYQWQCDAAQSDTCVKDCADNNANTYPGAPEICDGLDNDCDLEIDEGAPPKTFYRDADGDTYGNPAISIQGCVAPEGYVENSLDCNDGNKLIKPGAPELCNNIDDDCDGLIDEGLPKTTYCADRDADFVVNKNDTREFCSTARPEPPYTDCPDPADTDFKNDCNDNDPQVYPGRSEECNDTIDNNCDGIVDCDDSICAKQAVCLCAKVNVLCTKPASPDIIGNRLDCDEDGFADYICLDGYECLSENCGDCDDDNAAVNPGADEICENGKDDDCDGETDEPDCISGCPKQTVECTSASAEISSVTLTDVTDNDCDGCVPSEAVCPTGTTCTSGNCGDSDDADPTVHECNIGCEIVVECTSAAEQITEVTVIDGDCDDFAPSESACPTGTTCSSNNCGDCDDSDNTTYPGAPELCDGKDNDCNGKIDEGCNPTTTTTISQGGGGAGAGSCIPQIFVTGFISIAPTENPKEPNAFKDFVIQNLCENTALQWSISPVTYTDSSGWITLIAPDKGTTKKSTVVTMFVSYAKLPAGTYQAQFTVSSNGGSALIVVRMEVPEISPPKCADDSQCDDGIFCNGSEKCDPLNAFADKQGCVPGTPPCNADQLCIEELDQCWGIEMLQAQSLQGTLSRPLFFGKRCTFLVLKPETPNNFDPDKSTLSLMGPTNEASGVSINERQKPLDFFGYVLVPVCIAKDATIGSWKVAIETDVQEPAGSFKETIEASFEVR